ncbi:glycoside hydrolase family 6 protein [Gordonia sputi]|uniref:glycoside hydrolase family 6 protein n=1 Tax=Gordonia sputi TaxID=36823 RepID=UPI003683A336
MRKTHIYVLVLITVVCAAVATIVAVSRTQGATPDEFFVDRQTQSELAKSWYPSDAGQLERIAGVSQARWFTDPSSPSASRSDVAAYMTRASSSHAIPVLTIYAAPHRDCGGQTAGGAPSVAAYKTWIDALARGIQNRTATVIVEPDGLSQTKTCLSASQSADRVSAISYAVAAMSRMSNVRTYVDIGHSRWLGLPDAVQLLRQVNVSRIRGFSLNVSNFFTTVEEQAYGEALAEAVGGDVHYVVDTSRNGNGPAPASDPQNWCNPRGRALGALPTMHTSAAHADAYLWVKHPGESDGACRPGEPTSGNWFQSWALETINNTK